MVTSSPGLTNTLKIASKTSSEPFPIKTVFLLVNVSLSIRS